MPVIGCRDVNGIGLIFIEQFPVIAEFRRIVGVEDFSGLGNTLAPDVAECDDAKIGVLREDSADAPAASPATDDAQANRVVRSQNSRIRRRGHGNGAGGE